MYRQATYIRFGCVIRTRLIEYCLHTVLVNLKCVNTVLQAVVHDDITATNERLLYFKVRLLNENTSHIAQSIIIIETINILLAEGINWYLHQFYNWTKEGYLYSSFRTSILKFIEILRKITKIRWLSVFTI